MFSSTAAECRLWLVFFFVFLVGPSCTRLDITVAAIKLDDRRRLERLVLGPVPKPISHEASGAVGVSSFAQQ